MAACYYGILCLITVIKLSGLGNTLIAAQHPGTHMQHDDVATLTEQSSKSCVSKWCTLAKVSKEISVHAVRENICCSICTVNCRSDSEKEFMFQ